MLRPGELRILYALARNGPLRSEDLKEEASLVNPNVRSEYLKNLLKLGLITRSLDDRRFSIISFGWEYLYLNDLQSFIAERIALIEAKPPLSPSDEASSRMIDEGASLEQGFQRLKGAGIYINEWQPFILMTEMKQPAWDLDSLDFTKPLQSINEMFEKTLGEELEFLPNSILIFHTGFFCNAGLTKMLRSRFDPKYTKEDELKELVYSHFNGHISIEELFRQGAEILKK